MVCLQEIVFINKLKASTIVSISVMPRPFTTTGATAAKKDYMKITKTTIINITIGHVPFFLRKAIMII